MSQAKELTAVLVTSMLVIASLEANTSATAPKAL